MKNQGNRGFIKELSKPVKQEEKSHQFKYKTPIASAKADPMATPHRLSSFKSSKPDKALNMVKEMKGKK